MPLSYLSASSKARTSQPLARESPACPIGRERRCPAVYNALRRAGLYGLVRKPHRLRSTPKGERAGAPDFLRQAGFTNLLWPWRHLLVGAQNRPVLRFHIDPIALFQGEFERREVVLFICDPSALELRKMFCRGFVVGAE